MKRIALASLAALWLALPLGAETLADKAERLATYLEKSESWAMKAIVLLALGDVKHPAAVPPFAEALEDKDGRIVAYAVEALAGMPEGVLRSGATKDLVERLLEKELKRNSEAHHRRVLAILARIAGRELADRKAAESWWREVRSSWQPAPWQGPDEEPPAEEAGGDDGESKVAKLIEKLFDLGENGLEICFVIDATGSMQPTIDGVRDSIDSLAVLIGSIVPRFRIGVVIYRDLEDMKDGARVMSPLTTNYQEVKADLARETATGGGDFEERVEKGLELAIGQGTEMGWTAKPGKAVVVIGDAPPHAPDLPRAIELAKEAHENPFGVRGGVVTTGGKRNRIPPFIVSTIVVGAVPTTMEAFQKIAEAGGGACVQQGESSGILKQILILSFGQEWEKEIGRFVDLFLRFREEGIFR